MPKSKVRKKVHERHVREAQVVEHDFEEAPVESPTWLAPVMVGTFVAGLIWIVIFYLSQTSYPIPGIGAWNMLVGFSFIGVGFTLATRWR